MQRFEHLPDRMQTTADAVGITAEQLNAAPKWAKFLARDSRGWHWLSHHPRNFNGSDIATGALSDVNNGIEKQEGANYGPHAIEGRGGMVYINLFAVSEEFSGKSVEFLLKQVKKLEDKLKPVQEKEAALKRQILDIENTLRARGLKIVKSA
jgi:hypothetical protein